jgi:hypothetical protein
VSQIEGNTKEYIQFPSNERIIVEEKPSIQIPSSLNPNPNTMVVQQKVETMVISGIPSTFPFIHPDPRFEDLDTFKVAEISFADAKHISKLESLRDEGHDDRASKENLMRKSG